MIMYIFSSHSENANTVFSRCPKYQHAKDSIVVFSLQLHLLAK